jgi:3-oxoacyl-[acyl-carrier protein] reductase
MSQKENTMSTKTALVTGGVRGIGLAIAEMLLTRAMNVVVVTHDAKGTPSTFAKEVEIVELDLSVLSNVEELVQRKPNIDVLVNNAGHMNGFGLDQYDDVRRNHIFNLNLIAPVHLMWRYGNLMAGKGGGRIVNNTSIAAHIGHPDTWYGVTKSGLLNATKSLARAWGPKGIVVNAVAAGPTDTDMLLKIPEARKAAMKSASILGRFANAEEVAGAVAWLALDAPAYINGICIDVNNGSFMR